MHENNSSISIKNKLIFLVIMPVIGLILMFLIYMADLYGNYKNLQKTKHLVQLATKISLLIHETQIERGASAGFLGNQEEFKSILAYQKKITSEKKDAFLDYVFQLQNQALTKEINQSLKMVLKQLEDLEMNREKVLRQIISQKEIIAYFTQLNSDLIGVIENIAKVTQNSEFSIHLIAYINYLYAKDSVGVQRAVGTTILTSSSLNHDLMNQYLNLHQQQTLFLKNFFRYASESTIELYKENMTGIDIDEVNRMNKRILNLNTLEPNASLPTNLDDAQYWFTQISSKINKLKKVDDYLMNQLKIKIHRLENEAKISMSMIVVSSIVLILFVFILGYAISKNIHNSIENIFSGLEKFFKYANKEISDIPLISTNMNAEINQKVKELNQKILQTKKILDSDCKFLEESRSISKMYEYAMEKSNIILRINLDKQMTYANDLFYNLTKYEPQDIINKPYSDIKPKDVSEEEIDKLFRILNAGKVWKGTLTNIDKEGKLIYSIATVVPIKNKDKEVLEYMQIRQDITEVINLHKELEKTQREVIYKMGEIVETRSEETGNHVKVVAQYSKLLALKYGLTQEEAELIEHASPMHDIGKVGIPDSILNKPDKLTPEEFELMKSHSTVGYDILKTSSRPILKASAIIAYEHHEKWDGTGYPRGLKGDEIHIYGRITALADVFDALGSERVYKKAWKLNDVLEFFKEQRGKHFDPKLVDVFFENLEEFIQIREKYK
jgi:PAS domain S-box-containing protein